VSALKKITYPKENVAFVIIDNPHPQYGHSVRYIQDHVMPFSGKELPQTILLPQEKNLGFAGGNNVGIKWAIDNGFNYVFLHNNDGFVASNCFEPIVDAMENDRTIGAAQSLMLMYPETDLINSSGNPFQFLGLGYCGNLRAPKNTIHLDPIIESAYASGGAIMLRADLLKQYGLWDEDYFMYHEDIEYSFRLRIAGYRTVAVRDSVFYHKYSFGRNKVKFYCIERNRIGLMLTFFKIPTLLVFAPMWIVFDLGLLVFSAKQGWLKEKLSSYAYWLTPFNWNMWLKKRKYAQSIRKIKDKDIIKHFTGKVVFAEKAVNNIVLEKIANPIMDFYFKIIKRVIIW
jgi:GT2 family glycosyltransferase